MVINNNNDRIKLLIQILVKNGFEIKAPKSRTKSDLKNKIFFACIADFKGLSIQWNINLLNTQSDFSHSLYHFYPHKESKVIELIEKFYMQGLRVNPYGNQRSKSKSLTFLHTVKDPLIDKNKNPDEYSKILDSQVKEMITKYHPIIYKIHLYGVNGFEEYPN